MLAPGPSCSLVLEPWEEGDRSETAPAARWEGRGQGHLGTSEHITGKSPVCSLPSRPCLLCPRGVGAGAAKPFLRLSSSLQPLPGKGGLEPELGLVCKSLALMPSSSSVLLCLLAGFVESDLPAKESPCSPSRADMISEDFGSQRFYFLSLFPLFQKQGRQNCWTTTCCCR